MAEIIDIYAIAMNSPKKRLTHVGNLERLHEHVIQTNECHRVVDVEPTNEGLHEVGRLLQMHLVGPVLLPFSLGTADLHTAPPEIVPAITYSHQLQSTPHSSEWDTYLI